MKLSALLGLWESAVELALNVDLTLAKSIADQADCMETQRQLWLTIGKNILEQLSNIFSNQKRVLGYVGSLGVSGRGGSV